MSEHALIYGLLAVDLVFSFAVGGVLVFHLRKLAVSEKDNNDAEKDSSLRRQVQVMAGRLLSMEQRMTDFSVRIDAIGSAAVRQELDRHDFFEHMQEVSISQLEHLKRIESKVDKHDNLLGWIHKSHQERPCFRNEVDNGGESCPDGHPIEGAGKMAVRDESRGDEK